MNTEPAALTVFEAAPLTVQHTKQRALLQAWEEDLQARAAAGLLAGLTAKRYARNAEAWLAWLDVNAVDVPTPRHVLVYVAGLREGHKPATVNASLAALRAFYSWAETQNLYPAIARSVRGLKVQKDEPLDCLPAGEVARLLQLVDVEGLAGLRDAALVHVLFSTGLRLVSLTAANIQDLDTGDAVLTYRGKGDTDKTRRAYLSAGALNAVDRYLKARRQMEGELSQTAPLFAAVGNRAGGARLSSRSVRRVVVGLMERAGHIRRDLDGKLLRPGVLSCHSLRRSAITAAFESAGLDAAQTLAGHADPKTTRRAYARVQKGRVLRSLAGVLDLERLALGAA